MEISRLELFNFRNYRRLDLELSPGENLLIGNNAQGKTNLLESVYLLSHLVSPRTPRLSDLVTTGESFCSVRGLIIDGCERTVIRVAFGGGVRAAEVNGVRMERASKVTGLFKCVLFTPEDLYMVRGEPARRRLYLDETMEVLGRTGADLLSRYRHILKQRNALLKRWESHGSRLDMALEPWDRGLAKAGARIVRERIRMMEIIRKTVGENYASIAGEKGLVDIRYRGSFEAGGGEIEEEMVKALMSRREREKKHRTTIVGPHRDEVEISIAGRDARYSASQGEQRSVAFCLRMAQRRIIEDETGKRPVLLLDDVLSELDSKRSRRLIEMAGGGGQMILASTERPAPVGEGAREFLVRDGGVEIEGA